MKRLAEVRKFLAAATGAAGVLASEGLLSGAAEHWTTGLLAAATAGVVLLIPNADPKPKG